MKDHRGMSWFPCYVNDLLGSMRWKRMTPAERGAYWQLICWQMQADDGRLPGELESLSALADLDVSGHPLILDAFPLDEMDNTRYNPRAYAEWKRRTAIAGVRSVAGKKGMDHRWKDHNKCYPVANSKNIALGTTSTITSTTTSRTHTALRARGGIAGLCDTIRQARAEYAGLSEPAVAEALKPGMGKPDDLAAAVGEWASDQANAMKPLDVPLASIRKLVARVMAQGGNGSGARDWRAAWASRFSYRVRDDVAGEITQALDAAYPGWQPDALVAALDAIAKEQASNPRGPRAPTIEEIKDAMRLTGAKGARHRGAERVEITEAKRRIRAAATKAERMEIAKALPRAADVQAMMEYAEQLENRKAVAE